MKIFNLDNEYNVVCEWKNTSYGFRHIAILHRAGREVARAKTCYYNRTWECYDFETTLIKIIEDNFTGEEKTKFLNVIKYDNLRKNNQL
jgi:hypothetical protein